MTSIDCNKEMTGYHANNVTLQRTEQDEMRERRDNGRIRLRNGLANAGHPLPKESSLELSHFDGHFFHGVEKVSTCESGLKFIEV